jgi:tetratricopeptide (TPR) repeat protein
MYKMKSIDTFDSHVISNKIIEDYTKWLDDDRHKLTTAEHDAKMAEAKDAEFWF